MSADGHAGGGDLARGGRVGARHAADHQEGGAYAIGAEHAQHRVGAAGNGTVVEGEHDLALAQADVGDGTDANGAAGQAAGGKQPAARCDPGGSFRGVGGFGSVALRGLRTGRERGGKTYCNGNRTQQTHRTHPLVRMRFLLPVWLTAGFRPRGSAFLPADDDCALRDLGAARVQPQIPHAKALTLLLELL